MAAVVAAVVGALAFLPEWRAPGFYFHDDMQLQYVPAIVEIGRALRAGHLPILSPNSWFGGALAGEYQHGVFSLFHCLLCACVARLRLPIIACVVSLSYFALAGAGAYLAARVLELGRALAVSVALVAALNGFNVTWCSWLPAISGWAWLMWFWWAVERLGRAARWRWTDVSLLAFTTYSVLTAGWHFSDLLMPAIVASVLWRRRQGESVKALMARAGVALALGLGLALPAVLCFLEYARAAARSDFDQRSWVWTVPWQAIKGLALPLSTAPWVAFQERVSQSNIVMAGGLLPVLVVATALVAPRGVSRRAFAGWCIAACLALAWCMLPSLSRVRWPFRWLPAFHLLVVLAAARVLSLKREQDHASAPPVRSWARVRGAGLVAATGVVLVVSALCVSETNADTLACAAGALLSILAYPAAVWAGCDEGTAFCATLAFNLIVVPLGVTERRVTPGWPSLERCVDAWANVDRKPRYLGVYLGADIIHPLDNGVGRGACLLPGNTSMLDGLTFVNGYSTLFVAGLERALSIEVHGDLNVRGIVAVIGPFARPGALLDRWGIDRLVLPSDPYLRSLTRRVSDAGFRPLQELDGAQIWAREGPAETRPLLESVETAVIEADPPSPHALAATEPGIWHYAQPGRASLGKNVSIAHVSIAPVSIVSELVEPTRIEARVSVPVTKPSSPRLILLRRPYLPGYRARLDGEPLELGRLDGALVGVVLPAGSRGHMTIEYVPLGLRPPALFGALGALLVIAGGLGHELIRRRRGGRLSVGH